MCKNNACNKQQCSCGIELKSNSIIYEGLALPRLNIVPGDTLTTALYNAENIFEDIYGQLDVAKKEVVVITTSTTLDISHNGKIIYVANNPGITITIPLGLTKNTQFTFDTNIGFTLATAAGVVVSGNMLPMPYNVLVNTDVFAYFTSTNNVRIKKLS